MTSAASQPMPPSSTWVLPGTIRRVLLLVPALAFAVFEVFHPNPEINAEAVMDVATWFAAFHAIQLLLIGLVAVSVLILADEFGAAGAWTTRLGVGVFLVERRDASREALVDCPCGNRDCKHVWTFRSRRKALAHIPYQDDHVFASRALADHLKSCETAGFYDASDHAPILATFWV
jgi:hypothetical protein